MSQYRVIHRASDALRDVLIQGFTTDPDDTTIGLLVGNSPAERISLGPPVDEDSEETAPPSISLWLYLVNEQEHSKNRPHVVSREGNLRPPPLPLTLHYLVTPGAPAAQDGEEAQRIIHEILGKILQTFYDRPIVALVDREAGIAEELHLSLNRLSVEEMTRLWAALGRRHRLSLCYRVNIARIDSLRVSKGALILEREFEHTELVRLSG